MTSDQANRLQVLMAQLASYPATMGALFLSRDLTRQVTHTIGDLTLLIGEPGVLAPLEEVRPLAEAPRLDDAPKADTVKRKR